MGFGIGAGEVLAVLGRNGAGKSTTLKTVMGLVRPASGSVLFEGAEIAGWEPYRIARAGIGYVPEERRVFAELTVLENLAVGRRRGGKWNVERVFALFPALADMRDRAGGQMSGGEQQMLTIGRTLMGDPRLLLLDEPSEGLAPVIVRQISGCSRGTAGRRGFRGAGGAELAVCGADCGPGGGTGAGTGGLVGVDARPGGR